MAITKANMVDLVQQMYNGGQVSAETRIHKEEIALVIDMVVATYVGRYIEELRVKDIKNIFNEAFVKAYEDVEVLYNENREIYYAHLPAKPIILPNNSAVHQVSTLVGPSFFKASPDYESNFEGLEAASCNKKIGYYVEGDNINFINFKPEIDTVVIRMIPTAQSLLDNEPIPMPAKYEANVIADVLSLIKEQVISMQDERNDNQKNRQ